MNESKQSKLPQDIGGYQHVENGPILLGDIWVFQGKPECFVDDGWHSAEQANKNSPGWSVYRKMPTPSNRHDELDAESKESNPKDIVGSNKVPLHLWPTTATVLGSLALLDGMLKYGRTNYRAVGVRASIYHDALKRHVDAWFEGEDLDVDSGLPHLGHALACLAVLVDAQAAGKLNDDRVIPANYRKFMEEQTPHVARLKKKHADKRPKHYSIQDAK